PGLGPAEPPGAAPTATLRAAYTTTPTGTAERGAWTLSPSPEIPCSGVPARTGTANASRASSTLPGRCAVPPVSTTPAGSRPPPYPARSNSRCASWKISSTRWWMMCDSSSRDACRAPWLGVDGRLIISDASTSGRYAMPCRSSTPSPPPSAPPTPPTRSPVTSVPRNLTAARSRIFPSWKFATPVARHRHHPRRSARRDVLSRDAAGHHVDLDARHALGVAHRRNDRSARLVDVAHHTAPHARVLREPHAQHFGERQPRQLAHYLRDHGA